MNKKDWIEVIEHLHNLKMLELEYERTSRLLAEEHKWNLDNTQYHQQPQPMPNYYPQQTPPHFQQPQLSKTNLSDEERSTQKYAGKKN